MDEIQPLQHRNVVQENVLTGRSASREMRGVLGQCKPDAASLDAWCFRGVEPGMKLAQMPSSAGAKMGMANNGMAETCHRLLDLSNM